MDKYAIKRAVELCLAVYRITDKFPENEVLRSKLRGLSIAVIAAMVYKISYPKKELRVLFLCFDVAAKQGWVDSRNYEILKLEYTRLCEKISANFVQAKPGYKIGHREERGDEGQTFDKRGDLNRVTRRLTERQKIIVDFIKSQEDGATALAISNAIRKSSRTVLRELKILLKSGFIIRRGKTKGAKFFRHN